MLKLYQEDPEFDEFTKFDTETGKLLSISQEEFRGYFPDILPHINSTKSVQKITGKDATIFLGETPATHTRFPRRVYFQITRNCNLHCPYCFIEAERGAAHVPTIAAKELAAFLGQHGLMEVRLTGGEPTTHPDFFDILSGFQENDVYVSVATNGVIDQRTLDVLCEEKNLWIICSVDGNRETHNYYRPGTFDRIIRNLKYVKQKSPAIRLRLTTVLTKKNKHQMRELGEICLSVDAESITVIPLRPQLRDKRVKKEMLTAQEFRVVIEELVEVKEKLGIRVTTTLETEYAKNIYKDPVVRKRSSCAAGREATNIDYDASAQEFLVYGCSYSPAPDLKAKPAIRKPFLAGTFSADNIPGFFDIWRDDSAWMLFRDLSFKSNDCKECEYLRNHQCVGSCPIQNVDYTTLNVDYNILTQLKDQIKRTGEWYCYKKIKGE